MINQHLFTSIREESGLPFSNPLSNFDKAFFKGEGVPSPIEQRAS